MTVSEDHVEEGINLLLEIEKVVTEGAGAVGIAALVEHPSCSPAAPSAWS